MSLSTPDQQSATPNDNTPPTPAQDRGVLCPKCEHLNRWGTNECRRCGAHLYVSCVSCGAKNERVRTRCSQCGRRLHRGLTDVTSRFPRKKFKINLVEIILFLIVIGFAYKMIGFFAQMSDE